MLRSTEEFCNHIIFLSKGEALNVKRLIQYADYDYNTLVRVINHWNTHPEHFTNVVGTNKYRGVSLALTRALARVGDRDYRMQNRR